MSLSQEFSQLLRQYRESKGISQEELAECAGIDRTYVSQLERGLKSPTLNTVERIAFCLGVSPAQMLEKVAVKEELQVRVHEHYHIRDKKEILIRRDGEAISIAADVLVSALDTAHELIDQIYAVDLDIAAVLGMRNLSAFIGELFAASILKNCGGLFEANPHQDGYPDLLLMDPSGLDAWKKLSGQMNDKRPFSPFSGSGLEVKATCGLVPTPADCRRRSLTKPGLGDTRIGCMASYDWKAHHRETNNLAGILWDFIDRRPRIVALFYSGDLTEADWGVIAQPKPGGGRTTSVSVMSATGIAKMYSGWLCVLGKGGYADFINRKNRGSIMPSG